MNLRLEPDEREVWIQRVRQVAVAEAAAAVPDADAPHLAFARWLAWREGLGPERSPRQLTRWEGPST